MKENLLTDKTKKPLTKENTIIHYITPCPRCLVSH